MFDQYKYGLCSERAKPLLVGKVEDPNLLPQRNTQSPWPLNRMRVGESLFMLNEQTMPESRKRLLAAAVRVNRDYARRIGNMFAAVKHDTMLEIVRIK